MKILLVSATKFEVSPLLESFKKKSSKGLLSNYRIGKHSVDVLVTGVGMTSAAFHLGKCLNKKYHLAINAGVAGSFKKGIILGTVVNVVSDSFGDMGAEDGERFLTLKEMGLTVGIRSERTPSEQWAVGKNTRIGKILSNLPQVRGITVNTVHGNMASIKKVVRKFNPDVESMEGAAFFYACDQFKIPRAQIRAVSNYVERRNKKNWKLDLAIKNLNTSLERLLLSI